MKSKMIALDYEAQRLEYFKKQHDKLKRSLKRCEKAIDKMRAKSAEPSYLHPLYEKASNIGAQLSFVEDAMRAFHLPEFSRGDHVVVVSGPEADIGHWGVIENIIGADRYQYHIRFDDGDMSDSGMSHSMRERYQISRVVEVGNGYSIGDWVYGRDPKIFGYGPWKIIHIYYMSCENPDWYCDLYRYGMIGGKDKITTRLSEVVKDNPYESVV